MERPKILEDKEKIIENFHRCSTPLCGYEGLCDKCYYLEPFIKLFAYIDHLELILLQNNIKF